MSNGAMRGIVRMGGTELSAAPSRTSAFRTRHLHSGKGLTSNHVAGVLLRWHWPLFRGIT